MFIYSEEFSFDWSELTKKFESEGIKYDLDYKNPFQRIRRKSIGAVS
ncbi:hypothetical protein HOE04_01370 [archaeon]|jgi:hypothetical protein|nr:hypothetical protein [archaeon]